MNIQSQIKLSEEKQLIWSKVEFTKTLMTQNNVQHNHFSYPYDLCHPYEIT